MTRHKDDSNRAVNQKPRSKDYPFSRYIESTYAGKLLWVHKSVYPGVLKDIEIDIGSIEEEKLPVNIEIQRGDRKTEINKMFEEGINKIEDIEIERGDKIYFKTRDLEDMESKAKDIFITFNHVR